MIELLRGKVRDLGEDYLILDVGNFSLMVSVDLETSSSLKIGEDVELKVQVVFGEEPRIYGFLSEEKREIFRKLMRVSKVGPRTALKILSFSRVESLVEMVNSEDVESLAKIPGVGRKTAERIITELKGEMVNVPAGSSKVFEEAVQALVALGFSRQDAVRAVKMVFKSDKDVSETIRQALKVISKL